ncbi:MAG: CHAT domain-containing protein [Anaerolineae bacterium]|nr:CHAT domain-containing protein [Anaerolineae bacterium]
MIRVYEIQDQLFVVLRANLPADQAYALVEDDELSHVIVHRVDATSRYYLLTIEEALPRLRAAAPTQTVAAALDLDGRAPDPVLDPYADAETAPDRAVVVDGRHVTGYLDAGAAFPAGFEIAKGAGGAPSAPISSFLPGVSRDIPPGEAQPVARAMVTAFPERVCLGDQADLKAWLSAAVEAGGAPLAAPLGAEIAIIVEPVRGFRLAGPGKGVLQITSAPETLPLRFTLDATDLGDGRVDVYAYQGVQPLGKTSIGATVVAAHEAVDPTPERQARPLPAVGAQQPDLALYIHQHLRGPHPEFTMELFSLDASLTQPSGVFGPVPFTRDPEAYFQDFFQEIEEEPLDLAGDREVAAYHLESKGYHLFETLFPPDLRVLLWSLRGRIQSVQIVSGEPWIPWEMCKLFSEGPPYEAGPYLCEAFAVTRWKADTNPQPALTLNNVALVVPEDSGLAYAPVERDYLLSLAGGGRQVSRIPARVPDVIRAMRSGAYDGWHFTGHGRYREGDDPNLSALELEAYKRLTPENLSGPTKNLGLAHPLVFLNACNVGRRAMSLTDIGGWADKFLWAGAGAFVGAHWSIDDRIACDFTKALYQRMLAHGMPIGEAVRQSRLEMRDAHPGDPTWLAYTVFADPLAHVAPPS